MAARKDLGLYFKIQYKEAGAFRPKGEDVSTCDCTVKILWAQWDQLEAALAIQPRDTAVLKNTWSD